MSVAEMKKKIIEKVETLSESELLQIHTFIDGISKTDKKDFDITKHIDSIITEREEVLRKLAQ